MPARRGPWSVWLLIGTMALVHCGDSTPSGSPVPTPSGLPVPELGGSVTGRYLLEIRPATACGFPNVSWSFATVATIAGSSPHPGVQILAEGRDPADLELELKYTDFTAEGGVGTRDDGILSNQGLRLWVRAIATGQVTKTSDGRGEVVLGGLRGYLAASGADDAEGALASCTGTGHQFTLRAQ